MLKSTALPLPRPFCGKLNWLFLRDTGTHATQIECCSCGVPGSLSTPDEDTVLTARWERAA